MNLNKMKRLLLLISLLLLFPTSAFAAEKVILPTEENGYLKKVTGISTTGYDIFHSGIQNYNEQTGCGDGWCATQYISGHKNYLPDTSSIDTSNKIKYIMNCYYHIKYKFDEKSSGNAYFYINYNYSKDLYVVSYNTYWWSMDGFTGNNNGGGSYSYTGFYRTSIKSSASELYFSTGAKTNLKNGTCPEYVTFNIGTDDKPFKTVFFNKADYESYVVKNFNTNNTTEGYYGQAISTKYLQKGGYQVTTTSGIKMIKDAYESLTNYVNSTISTADSKKTWNKESCTQIANSNLETEFNISIADMQKKFVNKISSSIGFKNQLGDIWDETKSLYDQNKTNAFTGEYKKFKTKFDTQINGLKTRVTKACKQYLSDEQIASMEDNFEDYKENVFERISVSITEATDGKTIGGDPLECENLMDTKFGEKLKLYFNIIKIAAPILCIVLISKDLVVAVSTGNDDTFKKIKNNSIKRLIITAIIFLLPIAIEAIIKLANIGSGLCGIK